MTTQDPRDQAGGPARPDGAGTAGSAERGDGPGGDRDRAPTHHGDDRPAWLNGGGAEPVAAPDAHGGQSQLERPAWWTEVARPKGERDEPAVNWAPDWSSSAMSAASAAPTRPLGDLGPGAPGGPPPADPGTARPAGGVFRWLSLGLAGLLLVAAGVIAGQVLDTGQQTPAALTGVPPASAGPGPVRGTADEPVAAVAEALTPTVVQLEARQDGLGSGVVYDSNGYILTAAHVVQDVSEVTVRLADGTRLPGKVLGADAASDVGVVKVDRTDMPFATLATGVRLRVGQLAVAIGSPFGLEETVTSGVVSAVNRTLPNDPPETSRTVIQTDAAINPGNSGGALADRQGRVIGINSAIRTSGAGGGNVGVGFAVPIDIAARVAGQIVKGEPVRQTFLGVGGNNSPNDAGAVVTRVVAGSPAASVGLKVGDRITKFNGSAVDGIDDLVGLVRSAAPGTKVTLDVVRDGETIQVTPQLAENPE